MTGGMLERQPELQHGKSVQKQAQKIFRLNTPTHNCASLFLGYALQITPCSNTLGLTGGHTGRQGASALEADL
jgi:hypothetical protein